MGEAFKKQAEIWNEAKFKYLDIIVSSGKIRRMFFERCKELNLNPIQVAIDAGIKPGTFKTNYIDKAEPVCTRSFDQEKFLKMIESVGITIKVSVITNFSEKK